MKTKINLLAAGMLLAALACGFPQPIITNQPQNQTNIGGTTTTFAVGASGTPLLSYQWRSHANATTFTNIPWATSDTLILTNVHATSRKFGVVVTNMEGAVTSILASLNVPLDLTRQPTNYIADLGSTASFSALAVGAAPLFYQWRFEGQNLLNRTNANLYLRNLQSTDAGNYTVVVTNVAGAITSQLATLTVVTPLVTKTSGTNILFIIADDYGTDAISLYNTNANASLARTPNINSLYDSGVLFRNAYACPTCSPTRSCLMTGRYGFRTGIGLTIRGPSPCDGGGSDAALQANEWTIPKILSANQHLGYPHACVGKWHLGQQPTDPNLRGGWGHFSGSLPCAVPDYFRWPKTVDGVTAINTNYATTDSVNDALAWIQLQGTTNWFLWLALNAPHQPFHKPPNYLHSYETLPSDQNSADRNPRPYFEAMIEAMDTELGRLFSHIDRSNTVIIFLGDNGTTSEVIQTPFSPTRAKFTLYEGGIHVPLIISGPVVANPHRDNTNLVHMVDIFATILELAGANPQQVLPTNLLSDSHSLLPILTNGPVKPRDWLLCEQFSTSLALADQGRAIRDDTFKLIRLKSGTEEFYNLLVDPYETTNLLRNPFTAEQSSHYATLTATLASLQNIPQVTGFFYTSNRFAVSVGYVQGVQFSLQRSPSLGSNTWSQIAALSTSNDFIVTLTDTNAVRGQNFYRVSAPVR
jgi:arylsulfatase A-like enzyme